MTLARPAASLLAAATAAAVAASVAAVLDNSWSAEADPRRRRVNHRGDTVTLAGGPAALAGVMAGAAVAGVATVLPRPVLAAGAVALAGAGAVGWWDDARTVDEGERRTKGLRGHLSALARGTTTAGAVKLAGLSATGLASGRLAGRGSALVDGGAVAGTANVVNLLDLRPGRAAKATLLLTAPLAVRRGPGGPLAAAVAGAAAGVLPRDLAGVTMLGDLGAAVLGAGAGVAAVTTLPRAGRTAWLAAAAALTLASERVSFSAVIDRTPALRRLDALGRPRHAAAGR